MHIKFLPHGTGVGQDAIDYLLGEEDHKGEIRAGVEVWRGNPALTGKLIDSLKTVHRYSSAVINFSPEDNPNDDELNAFLDDFERVSFAGLEKDQYDWSAVVHREKNGGVHIHVIVPRVELTNGRAMNVAPPGWQLTYDPLRDALNHEKGWARPDDPSRARLVQQGKAKPQWRAGVDHKIVLTDYLTELVANGLVSDRQGVLQALGELGEITRAGTDYVSVKLEGSAKAIRLKGLLYADDFTPATIRKVAEEAARRPAGRGRPDEAAARSAREALEEAVQRRTDYNRKRYPALRPGTDHPTPNDAPAAPVADALASVSQPLPSVAPGERIERVELVDGQASGAKSAELRADLATADGAVLQESGRPEAVQITKGEVNDRARELTDAAIDKAQRAARTAIQAVEQCFAAASRAAHAVGAACRRVDRAMSAMKNGQADELERFKSEINLVEFAQSLGYEIIKKESSKASIVMRSGGDKIIVSTDKADGHGIYFSLGDDGDNGSLIDFAQKRLGVNLGLLRKELRGWLPAAARPSPKRKPAQERPERPQPVQKDRAQLAVQWARMKPYDGSYLTNQRRITQATIDAFGVRQDQRGNAVFRHRDSAGNVCGWEVKNDGFTGFSAGGEKGLMAGKLDSEPVQRIALFEASIDAMSYAQMHHQPGTMYVSLGGEIKAEQLARLKAVQAANPSAVTVSAFDKDPAGDAMARRVQENSPQGVQVIREAPTVGKDWNDALKAKWAKLKT